ASVSFPPIADIGACCQRMAMKAFRATITFALLGSPACLLAADSAPHAKLGQMQVREFDSRTGAGILSSCTVQTSFTAGTGVACSPQTLPARMTILKSWFL